MLIGSDLPYYRIRDPQGIDTAVLNFMSLEIQLRDCLEYIPFVAENLGVVSPKFIPIIMDSCSLIDSIFFNLVNNESRKYNFKDYARLFESWIDLEESISLFLINPILPINPFKHWTRNPPDWWQANNKLKHNRLGNYQDATINNAVMAMTALHQVMARIKDFTLPLLKAGWIDTSSIETVENISSVEHLGNLHALPAAAVIETQLFVSSSSGNIVTIIDDRYFEFDYSASGVSNRLSNLLFGNENT